MFDSNEVVEIPETVETPPADSSESFVDMRAFFADSSVEGVLAKPLCPPLEGLIHEIETFDPAQATWNTQPPAEEVERSCIEDVHVELDPEMAPIPVAAQDFDLPADDWSEPEPMPAAASATASATAPAIAPATAPAADTTPQEDAHRQEIETLVRNTPPTEYRYFVPSHVTKSWAGPSHWQISKVAKPKKAAERATHSKKKQVISFSAELKPGEFPVMKRSSDLVISDAAFESQSDHLLPDDHHVSFESLTRLFCRDDIVLHRLVHFNTESASSLTPDQWEVSPNNVDVGGCSLENPMDVLSVHQTEPSLMDDGPMDLSLGGADEVNEPSHVGFISEINDSSAWRWWWLTGSCGGGESGCGFAASGGSCSGESGHQLREQGNASRYPAAEGSGASFGLCVEDYLEDDGAFPRQRRVRIACECHSGSAGTWVQRHGRAVLLHLCASHILSFRGCVPSRQLANEKRLRIQKGEGSNLIISLKWFVCS